MKPRDLILSWVAAFNRCDADELAALYSDTATNHQVVEAPVFGREAIRTMFKDALRWPKWSALSKTFSRTANGRSSNGAIRLGFAAADFSTSSMPRSCSNADIGISSRS
jgi:hypothetical protein